MEKQLFQLISWTNENNFFFIIKDMQKYKSRSVEDRFKLLAVKYLVTIAQIIPQGGDKRSFLIKIKQTEYSCKYSQSLFYYLG